MPTPAYLSIWGTNQGLITKDVFGEDSVGHISQKDHENEILVQAFEHVVTRPSDPMSGQHAAHRHHRPLMITKRFDKSSPLLLNALAKAESLTCTLKWYRPTDGGIENYFTMELEQAVIVEINSRMPNCQDLTTANVTHLQDVYFSFRKIKLVHVTAGTEAVDDWRKIDET